MCRVCGEIYNMVIGKTFLDFKLEKQFLTIVKLTHYITLS